jgi:hypothetical protein
LATSITLRLFFRSSVQSVHPAAQVRPEYPPQKHQRCGANRLMNLVFDMVFKLVGIDNAIPPVSISSKNLSLRSIIALTRRA